MDGAVATERVQANYYHGSGGATRSTANAHYVIQESTPRPVTRDRGGLVVWLRATGESGDQEAARWPEAAPGQSAVVKAVQCSPGSPTIV
ncbi:hypothetical protein J6590_015154 [Homalodisca vitripennis]|nr:hypothetical protein J6590_015154 [Homalodisca vitripennis]